jgi:fumarate reductase flavoprotein subunit
MTAQPGTAAQPSNVDVVVIGAGCGGLCAAVEAAERGLKVALVEKFASSLLSTTATSGGYFAFVDTDLQRKQRILDSDEAFRRDMAMSGGGKSDPALVELYLAHQLDTYYWLQEHGAVFWHVDMGIGMNVPRCHATDPQRVLEVLTRSAHRLSVRLSYEWPVASLAREGNALRVSGPGGASLTARHGAILATGGFSRSPALLARFVTGLERVRLVDGGIGSTGDGIVLAQSLGAGLAGMEGVKPNFYSYAFREPRAGLPDRFQHETPVGMVYHGGGILVTQAGRRYVREDLNAKDIAMVTLKLPEAMSWGIFDESVRRRVQSEKTIYLNPLAMAQSLKADTLEELARLAGLPPETLAETVRSYNANCREGRPDPVGREHLTAKIGEPFPLEEPPYYAFATAPNMATTFGGLRIDPQVRVLDRGGSPIAGLYVCGEIVGGFHGTSFMTGVGLGQAATFGRAAARHVAARAGAS